MNSSLILALDIGTSSIRAGLFDTRANEIPETMIQIGRDPGLRQGETVIDADELFLQVVSLINDLIGRTGAKNIDYAATSAFWHSLLGIDHDNKATTSVFGWDETRPRSAVRSLRKDLDEDQVHRRTGCRLHASYWPAKILWLKEEKPDAFKNTAKWISFSDYIFLKLFGKTVTSVSMASGTGLFDIRKCAWDLPLLDYLGICEDHLPLVVEADRETFTLSGEYSERWGSLRGVKWFPAVGDGAANNIGVNCVENGRACLMVGTSGAMRVAFEGEVPGEIPPGLWCYRIDRRRIIIGGALSDGGGLYQWLKDNLQLDPIDKTTSNSIENSLPDAHGLTFMPFLAGERSTGYHDDAKGAIIGLTASSGSADIVRSALESVAYRFAAIYSQLNEVAEIREIYASGGALRDSAVWTQIICDVLGKDLHFPQIREASLRGAVLLASEASGQINHIADQGEADVKIFDFNPEYQAIYENGRKRHEDYYKIILNEF